MCDSMTKEDLETVFCMHPGSVRDVGCTLEIITWSWVALAEVSEHGYAAWFPHKNHDPQLSVVRSHLEGSMDVLIFMRHPNCRLLAETISLRQHGF